MKRRLLILQESIPDRLAYRLTHTFPPIAVATTTAYFKLSVGLEMKVSA